MLEVGCLELGETIKYIITSSCHLPSHLTIYHLSSTISSTNRFFQPQPPCHPEKDKDLMIMELKKKRNQDKNNIKTPPPNLSLSISIFSLSSNLKFYYFSLKRRTFKKKNKK